MVYYVDGRDRTMLFQFFTAHKIKKGVFLFFGIL